MTQLASGMSMPSSATAVEINKFITPLSKFSIVSVDWFEVKEK
jgi:hypothetical protein